MRVSVRTEPANQAFVATLWLPILEEGLTLRSNWNAARRVDRVWELEGVTPGGTVTVSIAGRSLEVAADDTGVARIEWDGLDASGAPSGPSVATAVVDGVTRRMRLGKWDAAAVGLGGLLLGGYDVLDVVGRTIRTGSGRNKGNVAIRRVDDGFRVGRSGGRESVFDGDGFLLAIRDSATGTEHRRWERSDDALRSVRGGGPGLDIERTDDGFEIVRAGRRIGVVLEDGRVGLVRSPGGAETRIEWQGRQVSAITDADGFTHRFEYDDDGRLNTLTRPGGGTQRFVRLATQHGRKVTVLTAEGRESSYQVEVLPDGTRVRTTRCCGQPPRIVRITGAGIEMSSEDGSTVRKDRATGTRRVTLPSGMSRERTVLASGVTMNGRTWRWETDGDAVTSTSPEGRVKGIRRSNGVQSFVSSGRRVRVGSGADDVSVGGVSWTVEHDEFGLVTRATTDGSGSVMRYDESGWLTRQDFLDGRNVELRRSGTGRILGVTSSGGAETVLAHSVHGADAITFPGGGDDRIVLDRDRDGLVIGARHGSEPPLTFRRDENGLIAEVLCGDDRLATHTHEHGRPVRAETAVGQVTTLAWDGPLLTSMTQQGVVSGTVTWSHDDDFAVDGIRSGGLGVALRRDLDGLVTGLVTAMGDAVVVRDAVGRMTSVRVGVVEQHWTFDEDGREASTRVVADGVTVWEVTTTRDQRGRVVGVDDSRVGVSTFTYDPAGRLAEATGPFPFRATWSRSGNPESWRRGDVEGAAAFAPDDRIVTHSGAPVRHDGAGRISGFGDHRFEYEAGGRLALAADDGSVTRVTRDAFGRIVRLDRDGLSPTMLLPGPDGHPAAVVDDGGSTRMLFVGGSAVSPPLLGVEADRTLLLAVDQRGTVRLVIDAATGVVVDERVHDHWGRLMRRVGESEVPFGWGCGLLDTSPGVVHFPARSYSADLMRFLSRDPLLHRGGSTNLYAFAEGDPINRHDPTGTRTRICRQAWYKWTNPFGSDEIWEHWWLEQDGQEAGWGPDPDSWYNKSPLPGEFGEVRDHGERSQGDGVECDEVEDVDEECVARGMKEQMGKDLGFWAPGNTCQNWVDDLLNQCSDGDYTVVTDNPDAYDNIYGPQPETRPPDPPSEGYTSDDGPYTPVDGHETNPAPKGTSEPDPEPSYTPADAGELWE